MSFSRRLLECIFAVITLQSASQWLYLRYSRWPLGEVTVTARTTRSGVSDLRASFKLRRKYSGNL